VIRLSLVAPSGSGKSSAAGFLRDAFQRRGHSTVIIKLADPLYRLQTAFYTECGMELAQGTQNRHLMENIATQLRSISPTSLLDNFVRQVEHSEADVVINDDLRDYKIDWPGLVALGFQVILIVSTEEQIKKRLSGRGDIGINTESQVDKHLGFIKADYKLANQASLDDLRLAVETMVDRIIVDAVASSDRG
jgi:dephospho-CoA kinase